MASTPTLGPLTIVGDGQDPRVTGFQQAVVSAEQPLAELIDYHDLLAGGVPWETVVRPGGFVRIESPGRCPAIRHGLLARGHRAAIQAGIDPVCPAGAEALIADKGRIVGPMQWYWGFCDVLNEIETAVAGIREVIFTAQPVDITLLFDKRACRERLSTAGISVPPSLGRVYGYDDLRSRMKIAGWARAYLKLNYGSAGSGIVAFEASGRGRAQAWTSVEMVNGPDDVRLYNSRRIRRYTDAAALSRLIDELCQHDVHTEAWIPKAGLNNRRIDVRIVTIAGRPTHVTVRLSASPLTNLHLGNTRADSQELMQRMGPENWQSLMNTCTAVARMFPRTLHLGMDVAITPGFRRHVVLEVNAFGDLLKSVYAAGGSTYDAEIQAMLDGWGRRGLGGLTREVEAARC